MNRTSPGLVLLVLIVLLAACAAPRAPAPTAAPAQPAVTLTFAAFERDRETYAAAIETFNAANPDVRVQFVPLEDALAGARRGRAPESTAAFTNAVAGAADTAALFALFPVEQASPAFQDLTPFIEADPQFDRTDFFPAALPPAGTPLTALPLRIELPLLAYNRELWEQRGVPAPTDDWSWNELLAALDQLVAGQGELRGLLNGGADSHAATALLGELAEQSPAAETPRLDTPEAAAALQRTVDRVGTGALPAPLPTQGQRSDDPAALILANRASLWPLELAVNTSGDVAEHGWLPFPAGSPVAPTPIQALVMSAGTAQPQAAWRWLSFLSRQDVPPPGNTALGPAVVPARRSQLEASPAWRGAAEEQRGALRAALERPAEPIASQLATRRSLAALAQALRAVLDEGQSPAVALAAAQASLAAAPANTSVTAAPQAVATPAPSPPADVVTIRYAPFYQDLGFIAPDIERFEAANPGIRVELRDVTSGEFSFQSFASSADLFFWWGDPLEQPEVVTAALDLQPLIDADLGFQLADYPAGLLDLYRADGRLVGLPQTVYLSHIGYNADLLAEAGVVPPAAGWTLEEFVTLTEQLAATDAQPPRYGFGAMASYEALVWFVASRDVELVVGAGDTVAPNYSDPAVRSALAEGLDLLRAASPHRYIGYSPASFARDDGSFGALRGGSVALWWDSGFTFAPGMDQPTFQRGMLPLPQDNAGGAPLDAAPIGLHISANSSHPEAAWRLLRFLASEVPTRYSGFPARTSLAESEAFRAAAPLGAAEVYAASGPLLAQLLPVSPLRRLWQIEPYWLFRALDRALQGGDLDQELTDAQFLTEQQLACVRGGERPGVCARQVDPSYDGELEP